LLAILINFIHLINARRMEHIKLIHCRVHKELAARAYREPNEISLLFISCLLVVSFLRKVCVLLSLLIISVSNRSVYIVSERQYCVQECTAAVKKIFGSILAFIENAHIREINVALACEIWQRQSHAD
jgi:hypothetical protein